MKLYEKYLMTEKKEVEFDSGEIKMLDKAFKRNNDGELTNPFMYSFSNERYEDEAHVDIVKFDNGFEVYHFEYDEDGESYNGDLSGMKDRNLKSLINKIKRRM